jgi:hypothetical protein
MDEQPQYEVKTYKDFHQRHNLCMQKKSLPTVEDVLGAEYESVARA